MVWLFIKALHWTGCNKRSIVFLCMLFLTVYEESIHQRWEGVPYLCVWGSVALLPQAMGRPAPGTNRRMTGSNGMYQDAVILAWVNGADLHSELAAHWLETTLGQMWFLNCQILTILRWLADMRLVLFCYLARPPPTFRPQITSNQSISRAQAIHIGWRALQQMNIMGAT